MCTVEAHHKIAALAPDNSIHTVQQQLQSDDHVEMYTTVALFCVAMSEGFESHKAWEEPGYTPNPLTLEEVNHLRRSEIDELFVEAYNAFLRDVGVSVETEPPKEKKDAGGASS